MKFSHDGKEYRIEFKYTVVDGRRETTCLINTGATRESEETYSVGNAMCSEQDQFNRETGRELALKRALDDLPRPFRAAAWTAYRNRVRVVAAEA